MILPFRYALALLAAAPSALAQLPPPPVPPENPITEEKRILGKLLFWEEQLSSDDTIACATCHIPQAGGSDPRTARHPGPDSIFFNDDDKLGSPGVADMDGVGDYEPNADFGFGTQVTARASQSFLMGAYAPDGFWDGRATSEFIDPQTGLVSIPVGGSLESQAAGPPLSDVEMAHSGHDWNMLTAKLAQVTPMALASNLPPDMATIMSGNPSYGDLFQSAFGDAAITAERIAYAIATYERTLIPDQTPWDLFMAGNQNALTSDQQMGWMMFQGAGPNCVACHVPPEFTDHSFRTIGLRPPSEDMGRADVTGDNGDRGGFKVPSLRNAALKPTHFHNGGLLDSPVNSMRDVVEFYARTDGHKQFNDNQDPIIPAIFIPPMAINFLQDFLENGLTDPRVANETFPFDRPTLASEVRKQHLEVIAGTGTPGSGGVIPQVVALTPATVGSQSFLLGLHDAPGGAQAFVQISSSVPGASAQGLRRVWFPVGLQSGGYGTWHWDVPVDPNLAGVTLFAQWHVLDHGAPGHRSRSDVVRFKVL